ncbi:PREDICTED: uncharacterized protein LOC109184951 [Ipomoea nil]|uniref:uncharacterized protein LOC109184951 n=1 Tax=Ipomoea nil TaxID=35883 RepID=UPI000901D35A|nr:PREDICTED: uncharacterized protein LOC109184951 [Ipomoea nil]
MRKLTSSTTIGSKRKHPSNNQASTAIRTTIRNSPLQDLGSRIPLSNISNRNSARVDGDREKASITKRHNHSFDLNRTPDSQLVSSPLRMTIRTTPPQELSCRMPFSNISNANCGQVNVVAGNPPPSNRQSYCFDLNLSPESQIGMDSNCCITNDNNMQTALVEPDSETIPNYRNLMTDFQEVVEPLHDNMPSINDDIQPKFAQLYIHDTENEIDNRLNSVRAENNGSALHSEVVHDIKQVLDEHNVLVKSFRMAKSFLESNPQRQIRMRLIGKRTKDARTYALPTTSEVAALIVGDIDPYMGQRDIVVECRSGALKRINELNPAYLPLQYPILFPYGEDGFREDIHFATLGTKQDFARKSVSQREYFAFRIHERSNEISTIMYAKRLFQQFLVDAYTMVESSRLLYIRSNQKALRCEAYKGLSDALTRGEVQPSSTGKRIILPSSFTGGARYMIQNYQDAMAICRFIGYPNLFITFTCNPKWPEIQRFLEKRNLKAEDRPDIVCRVFKLKLDCLIKEIKNGKLFGRVKAVIYTVEFQKRGLPHAHILLFLQATNDFTNPTFMDTIISAEIPDKRSDIEYYQAVEEFMLHGPCGAARSKSLCMANGKCSKHFPKRYIDASHFDQDGYPLYRRRDDKRTIKKNGIELDNRYVVPHNRSIKYLFKYVNKGNDRVTAEFYKTSMDEAGNEIVDEINMYYDCRYVSACEAAWRLFSFEVQYRTPPVERLSFHLPDCQSVVFQDDDSIDNVLNRETVGQSMFNAWFLANQNYKEASYTYNNLDVAIITDLVLTEEEKKNFGLLELENLLGQQNKSLKDFPPMPTPSTDNTRLFQNRLVFEELSYNTERLKKDSELMCAKLTEEQGLIFYTVIQDIATNKGGLFFVYGYGGTGKTFLWRALSAAVRCKGQIVLNVASSGIASLLLPGGRTAHSRFAIPIAINEDSTCNIKQGSDLAELLIKTSLIIRDEAPMMHKHCFEALDRTMRDLLRFVDPNSEMKTFGGKTVVLGGDFRQILPVVPKGTRQDIVSSAINSSYLWDSCKVLRLTKNLRLSSVHNGVNGQALQEFANWIANIGDGKLGGRNDGFAEVQIPNHMLVSSGGNDIKAIVESTFPMFAVGNTDLEHLIGRAILAPTLDVVNAVNEYITKLHDAESRSYYSSDAVCKADGDNGILGDVHTPEFLNSICVSGLPNHTLNLKIGSPVMLMRNIDHSLGLCNGTRLIITKLADHVIEGELLTGPNKGTKVLIPRMSMSPSDPRLPFKFQRRQFPLMLSYAMTINKSQGQTLTHVGLILKKSVFVHGQLYVAASRVNNSDGLKILIVKDSSSTTTSTTNVVYHEVFNNL